MAGPAEHGTAPGQVQGGQVDQAVPRRDEGRDGADPVGVRLEQWTERVLDRRGEDDHDGGLRADQPRLGAQHEQQQRPGHGAQDELPHGLPTPPQGPGVRQQHHGDPDRHDCGAPEVMHAVQGARPHRWASTTGQDAAVCLIGSSRLRDASGSVISTQEGQAVVGRAEKRRSQNTVHPEMN